MRQHGRSISKKRSGIVFRQGDHDPCLYFVQSGLLKAYYLSEEGKKHVKSFVSEGSMIGSLTSVYARAACSFTLVCLEDSSLVGFEFEEVYQAASNDPELGGLVMRQLLELAMRKEKREYEFLSLSAERRYELLCAESPHIIERVTQNDIARYLGITPVALSRIRRRIALKNS